MHVFRCALAHTSGMVMWSDEPCTRVLVFSVQAADVKLYEWMQCMVCLKCVYICIGVHKGNNQLSSVCSHAVCGYVKLMKSNALTLWLKPAVYNWISALDHTLRPGDLGTGRAQFTVFKHLLTVQEQLQG